MTVQLDKKLIRQMAYVERSAKARRLARMLNVFACIVMAGAIWSDPDLGPIVEQGFEEIRPTAAKYLEDTPLQRFLGPLPEAETAASEQPSKRITAQIGSSEES